MSSKSVVILAGGKGKRLRSITKNRIPKPLVKLNNKPFLNLLLNYLSRFKIKKIYIIAGYKGNKIKKLFHKKKIKNVTIDCLIEKKPLGTGGALNLIKNKIKNKFILINGDTFFKINMDKIFNYNLNNSVGLCVLTKQVQNSETVKLLNVNVSKRKIIFVKKSNFINSGTYLFSKKIFNYLNLKNQSLENDILPRLIKREKILGIKKNAIFFDIGTPKTIKKAQKIVNSINI